MIGFILKMIGKYPKVGELWQFKDVSPFESKYQPVKITDIKSGWVKYDMEHIKDLTMEVSVFVFLYKKYNEDSK